MVGLSCSSGSLAGAFFTPALPQDGYKLAKIPAGGPNGEVWYVSSAETRMDLRTQILREFRAADGDTFPLTGARAVRDGCQYALGSVSAQRTHTVNTVCAHAPDFQRLVSAIWRHEERHLNAAMAEARLEKNDVLKLLEPLVGQDESRFRSGINSKLNEIHRRIETAANATHAGQVKRNFNFWRYIGNGWKWATVPVLDR